MLDQQSGFGAVAVDVLHAIGDDFGRTPTFLFSLAPAAAPPRPAGHVCSAVDTNHHVLMMLWLQPSLSLMASDATASGSAWQGSGTGMRVWHTEHKEQGERAVRHGLMSGFHSQSWPRSIVH